MELPDMQGRRCSGALAQISQHVRACVAAVAVRGTHESCKRSSDPAQTKRIIRKKTCRVSEPHLTIITPCFSSSTAVSGLDDAGRPLQPDKMLCTACQRVCAGTFLFPCVPWRRTYVFCSFGAQPCGEGAPTHGLTAATVCSCVCGRDPPKRLCT